MLMSRDILILKLNLGQGRIPFSPGLSLDRLQHIWQ